MEGLEDESMDVDAGAGQDSDFEVEGGKKKSARKVVKKPKKMTDFQEVYNVDEDEDNSLEPKKRA
jgi:hypothetical protein